MVVQVDTREQKNDEVIKYFEEIEQPYFVSKIYAGDYIDIKNCSIVIDLKADLVELANNLTHEHDRFKAEIMRAQKEMKCKFVVLIRENLKDLEDVKFWKSPKRKNGKLLTNIKGSTLYAIMKTMSAKYGVIWKFCERKTAGREIIKILKGGV